VANCLISCVTSFSVRTLFHGVGELLKINSNNSPHPFCSIIFPHILEYNMHMIICSCVIINHSIPYINFHDVLIHFFCTRTQITGLYKFSLLWLKLLHTKIFRSVHKIAKRDY